MAVTPASFRTDFPEFADDTAYPDALITFWINVAVGMLNACRWGAMLDIGTELYVAHNLVLERQAAKTAAAGGVPGVATGAIASKAVGPVSQSYDTSAGQTEGAGDWNLTVYGQRFARMSAMFGAGGVQL
jgi:hypothetical protein